MFFTDYLQTCIKEVETFFSEGIINYGTPSIITCTEAVHSLHTHIPLGQNIAI